MHRLRELDFLRGLAIILVLFRHQFLFTFAFNMGWIGVDLFFVLSGFLVSGLLFREYQKFGDIQPSRFLIRRGFKIYPIYYIFYLLYIIPIILAHKLQVKAFISDMLFVQNYIWGWGYAYIASWSLAIEEHFYFGFSLLLWLGLKNNLIKLKPGEKTGLGGFEYFMLLIMGGCLAFRFYDNIVHPEHLVTNFTMTHLRIDSLLAGVFIAYLYNFKLSSLQKAFDSYKYLLFVIAIIGLSWTPFIDPLPESAVKAVALSGPVFFAKTLGFSLLYISFGILLVFFLLVPEINQKLNSLFTRPVVSMVSRIGYCSYSIYIIHSFVNLWEYKILSKFDLYGSHYVNFALTSVISVTLGMWMTYYIETYFLKIRNKYYPGRVI